MTAASADASFRRYWRLSHDGTSLIAVDAPPETENNAAFVRLASTLRAIGLNVPAILAQDSANGFLLVSDLGQRQYLDALTADTADRLYGDAIGALITLQAVAPTDGLPDYDAAFLRRELALFDDWLLAAVLPGAGVTPAERAMLDTLYARLIDNALEQPQVCVHRDFHSRNLMHCASGNPGILDFQDAVSGPVTYDLVSLLKDCYVDWPRRRVLDWAWGHFNLAVQSGVLTPAHESRFLRWFDLMGVQRHLKAAGIFVRLSRRDGRPDYLRHLPRTLGYLTALGADYPELAPLAGFLQQRVLPRLPAIEA
ncbi:phosphotransferase [Thiohalocapsa marina]|uniref:Phosphotransferase n=2 Tax=Thiohalocapsa marina TaxID=424902 RepID=A0A5M8FDA3_9GAMM|nr:phosphotransferase [Thiohalocapsa marina]